MYLYLYILYKMSAYISSKVLMYEKILILMHPLMCSISDYPVRMKWALFGAVIKNVYTLESVVFLLFFFFLIEVGDNQLLFRPINRNLLFSCPWSIAVEPDVLFFCFCSLSTSSFKVLCVVRCTATHKPGFSLQTLCSKDAFC